MLVGGGGIRYAGPGDLECEVIGQVGDGAAPLIFRQVDANYVLLGDAAARSFVEAGLGQYALRLFQMRNVEHLAVHPHRAGSLGGRESGDHAVCVFDFLR